MDLDEQPEPETMSPEVEAEILHRQATADDRRAVNLNELRTQAALYAQQQR
ncbi:hypothetical protein AB0E08_08210 [Streptomyces sp. NPDC048281]|uniref:hypothetical protein n=1 Tax=Streptomyces sp. NPDC048281 TaxID=3154715 RepID=UPI003439C003